MPLPSRFQATPPCPPDEELVGRASRGDRGAFGELVHRYHRDAWRQAWAILRNQEDAEDAVQEGFVAAWRAISRFDGTRPLRPWLLRIVANRALSIARRGKGGPHASLDADAALADSLPDLRALSPRECYSRRELHEHLAALVHSLPADLATMYHLRYEADCSLEEIADTMGRKPGTVAVALHRLREKFRQALRDLRQEEPS